jgi:hypothetical protein
MGLDAVELVLEVENAFGFSIPDDDAERLATVGQLYDYILARRFHAEQDSCLSSMAFYRVRRALISVLRIPRDSVRVATALATIIPRRRRRTWRAIEKNTGFRLPPLRRPQFVTVLAALITIALGIATSALLGFRLGNGGIIVALLSMGVIGFAMVRLTESLATVFPPDTTTVGELAKGVLARNYPAIVTESRKSATDAEVWDMLLRIISDQLGVRADQLTREANFVRDLFVA